MNRIILIVLDSLGVGELPDAAAFGDTGADTFGHILDRMGTMQIPHLQELGFCNITGAAGGRLAVDAPAGSFGRLAEISSGKDTTTGHWEIAGIETKIPFKTYPDGFPAAFMKRFEEAIGRSTLGNKVASGTEIIEELGDEHEATGSPIIYTSADSVFQVAANVDVIPLEELYRICETARSMLVGEYACCRVIARPYKVIDGKRVRTSDRHDYSVDPHAPTMLDHIKDAGKTVYAVGKIRDIFNGQGITESVHTENNLDGVEKTIEAMQNDFEGIIFTNLVDFDSKYGHRRDPIGYGKAIEEFDAALPGVLEAMKEDDILMLTADHGNDPVHAGFNHTREYIPFVAFGKRIKEGYDLGTRSTYGDIGQTICDILGAAPTAIGTSFKNEILK